MFNALHHERDDMPETLTNPMRRVRATSFARRLRVMMIIASLASSSPALASPFVERMHVRSQLLARSGNNNNGSGGNLQVWIPVIVVVLLIMVGLTIMWKRRAMRSGMLQWGAAAALSSGVAIQGSTLEVTAEQLAGTTPDSASGTSGPTTTARRARRNRRTPSQISTRSLPAYNKEPGDEELVIFRGPSEMEDVSVMPTTLDMPSLERDEDSMHSRNTSQASSLYPPEPLSAHDMPLLQHGSFSNMGTPSTGEDPSIRRSLDTTHSSEDAADPRGEAPPYFEVVGANANATGATPPATSPEPTAPPSSTPPPERMSRRASGFRSILNALDPRSRNTTSNNANNANNAPTHTRNESTPHATPDTRTPSRTRHRPSQSGSGSMLSLSPFRTISRQRSINTMNSNQMTSPSLISLNSISAPLTHTVVRTEFTYPKAGPTPEQLKLISSRETFARFGMPYGADAIAYAASTSRQELGPPPGFDASSSGPYAGETRVSESAISLATPGTSDADAPTPPENSAAPSGSSNGDGPAQSQEQSAGSSSSTPPDAHASTTKAVNGTHTPPTSKSATLGLIPPAAYKPGFATPRSVSRASSVMSAASYATAAESISDPLASNAELDLGSPAALQQTEVETPTTPRTPYNPVLADRASYTGADIGRAVWL